MRYINPEPSLDDEKTQVPHIIDALDYNKLDFVYFAFIDVLGFQKTFGDMSLSNNTEFVENYSDVFKYYFALMNSAKFMQDNNCYAGQTSDSLYFYTNRIDFLGQFIKIFSYFNLYAMSKNVFFRGGIAKGDLYRKEKYQFFGNSVINAYLLESKISKNPIILLDEDTYNDINADKRYDYLIDSNKRRHFVSPFAFLESEEKVDFIDNTILKKITSQKIQSRIKENMKLFEFDEKNFDKYVFLLTEFEKKHITAKNQGE